MRNESSQDVFEPIVRGITQTGVRLANERAVLSLIAGIPGALFAVPLAAFVNVVVLYVSRRSWETGVAPRPDEMIWSTVPRDRRKNA